MRMIGKSEQLATGNHRLHHALVGATGLCLLAATQALAQKWEARFPRDPRCDAAVTVISANAEQIRLRIVLVDIETQSSLHGGKAKLILRGGSDTLLAVMRADTLTFESLSSGDYVLFSYSIGYSFRQDSLRVDPGREYLLSRPMMSLYDDMDNKYNCRPRGFRRPGEKACVTTGEDVDFALSYAQDLAERGRAFGLPPFDSTQVRVVTDESTCIRAGKVYGQPTDPPRRVIVIQTGPSYMVYDPFETVRAGEWTAYKFFNSKWKLIVIIAG